MRNIRNKFLALLLITSVAFLSCKKQDPIPPYRPHNTTTTISDTTSNPTLTRGLWRVALFQESSVDETNQFNGYLFMFNSNGTISVTKDSSMINGTWSLEQENGRKKFLISFPSMPLSGLNGDWYVKGETFNDLKLEQVNGANGEADYLTFRRFQQE